MKLPWALGPRLRRVVQSYRFRHALFSLFFGLCVVGIYYLINWLVPDDYLMHNQLVTILFIIVAVLVLFPARERGLLYVLRRNEYTKFFGRDFHHLDVVARQFSVDTLVNEVFPEFMEWLGVRHGRIAILHPDRRHFDFYIFRNRQVHRGRHIHAPLSDTIVRGLKQTRQTVQVQELPVDSALRSQLEDYGAATVRPFHYRRRLLGFLILNETSRNRHAARALDFFADKAAVSIQNHILTNRIMDSRLYDAELSSAEKIQSTLNDAPVPRIPGFRLTRHNLHASILEFFPARRGDHWFVVGLTLDRLTGSGSMILYTMLGSLYSYITRETHFTMHRVLGHLRKHRDRLQTPYPPGIFVAELLPSEHKLICVSDDTDYRIRKQSGDPDQNAQNLLSSRARSFLTVPSNDSLLLMYQNTVLLEIHRSGDSA